MMQEWEDARFVQRVLEAGASVTESDRSLALEMVKKFRQKTWKDSMKKIKLPEPAIVQEQWGYSPWGEISFRKPNLIGYSPEQVDKIMIDYNNCRTLLLAARGVFDRLSKLGNGDCDGNSIGNTIAQEARAEIDRAFE